MNEIEALEQYAVDAAIHSDWKTAIEVNKKILVLDKHNLGALLRLGFSYLRQGKLEEAKKHYAKVLRLQPANKVARENMERIKVLEVRSHSRGKRTIVTLDPNLFLETTGKTKAVSLVNLGQKNTLAHLYVGQEVFLKVKRRKVEVRSKSDEYVGALPDDLSRRMLLFLKAGSFYEAHIKESSLNQIMVFLRELKKGKQVAGYISFPQNIGDKIPQPDAHSETDEDSPDVDENDLEKLAENLGNEEKDYLPFPTETEEENEE